MAWSFGAWGGDSLVREFLGGISHHHGKWFVLAIVMGIIFVIGFFLDFIEITFIHVPVLAPIMIEFGFDPAWFCILVAVNLQTSFMTPPFGFSLFYLKAVTPPEIRTGHIYRGIIPFVFFQLIGLLIVVSFSPSWSPGCPRWCSATDRTKGRTSHFTGSRAHPMGPDGGIIFND